MLIATASIAIILWFLILATLVFAPFLLSLAHSDQSDRNKGDALVGLMFGLALGVVYVTATAKLIG